MRRKPALDRGFLVGVALVAGLVWWLRDDRPPREAPPARSATAADYGGAADVLHIRADGRPVRFSDFRGKPLLVVFGAEWARDSEAQLAAVRDAVPASLTVVHVLTSTVRGYGHPATVETAAAWATRFDLPPSRVIAADLTTKALPAIALFDADGRLLAERTGLQDAAALRALIGQAAP